MSSNVPKKPMPITGVILAGGTSRRMGQNKALMQLGGDSLIGHVIHHIHLVVDELLLITTHQTNTRTSACRCTAILFQMLAR